LRHALSKIVRGRCAHFLYRFIATSTNAFHTVECGTQTLQYVQGSFRKCFLAGTSGNEDNKQARHVDNLAGEILNTTPGSNNDWSQVLRKEMTKHAHDNQIKAQWWHRIGGVLVPKSS